MRIIEKKLFKNTLAKVMAVTMAVTMIPAPVNASAENNIAITEEATIPEVTALPEKDSNGTKLYSLDENCMLKADLDITEKAILKLNNNTLYLDNDCWINAKNGNLDIEGPGDIIANDGSKYSPIIVRGNNSITIKDCNISNDKGYGITVCDNGTVRVEGNSEISAKYAAISGNNTAGDMNVYVLGGTLETKFGPCIYMPITKELVIGESTSSQSDQNITEQQPVLDGGISVRMGNVTINSGTIKANTNVQIDTSEPQYLYDPGTLPIKTEDVYFPDALFVIGGTYTNTNSTSGNDLNLTINGGNFICDNKKGSAVAVYDYKKEQQKINVTINGGNFTKTSTKDDSATGWKDESANIRSAFDVLPLEKIYKNGCTGYDKNNVTSINITGGNFTESDGIEDDNYIRNSYLKTFEENGIKVINGKSYCYKDTGSNITIGEHNAEPKDAQEAKANTPGNIAYKHCGNCGKYYTSNDEILKDANAERVKLYQLSLGSNAGNFTALFDNDKIDKTTASYGYYQGASLKITPNKGYSFKTAPSVQSNLTSLSCTVGDKAADGSYTCTVATSAAITNYQDAVLTVNASGIIANQYSVKTNLDVSNADVKIIKDNKDFKENGKVTINDTLTIKITPKEGYKFNETPSVTAAGECSVNNPPVPGSDGGYSYTVTGFKGDCNITVTANAELVKYTVSLDRKGLAETDADVKFVINGKDAQSASVEANALDKLQLVITPKAGRVFDSAPVVKSDGKSVAGTAVAENGSYKYTIHSFTGNTTITASGTAKAASHKVTLAATGLEHATAALDLTEVADGGTAKLIITPAEGYKITTGIKDIKAVIKNTSACKVSEAEAGANGTFVITFSGIKADMEITSVTAKAEKAVIVEAGTDTSVNVNEANLSNTFNTSEATVEEKKKIEENQKAILDEVRKAIGSAVTDSVIFFNGAENKTDEEKKKILKAFKEAVQTGTVALSIEVKEQKLDNKTEATVTAKIKEQTSSGNVKAGKTYSLDISLFAQIIGGNNENLKNVKKQMTTTGGKIKIQMAIPSDVPKKESDKVTRKYYILRIHDGNIEILPCTEKNGKLEFESDKFSTYVLYYTDTTTASGGNNNNNNNNNSSNNGYIPGPGTTAPASPVPTVTPSATPGTNPSAAPGTSPSTAPGTEPTKAPGTEPTKAPGTEPTAKPGTEPTKAPGTEPTKKPAASVKAGKKVTVNGSKYKVTSAGTNRTAAFTAPKNVKNITIPASIKISGKAYKVTSIANNAFKGNKKLAKVTIGANVKKIGKNAFNGCKNLKKIIIKTKKLTAKTTGKNAFKGINKKAVVKAPKNKIKSYNKIIKAKGAGKGVKVK